MKKTIKNQNPAPVQNSVSPSAAAPGSLKGRLLTFIILCWAAPIAAFVIFTAVSYHDGIMTKTESLIEDQMASAASFISIRLEDVIDVCQRPSYERVWENLWKSYKRNKGDKVTANRMSYLGSIYSSLRGKFYMDKRFRMCAFYEVDMKEPTCFFSRVGETKSDFVEDINPQVQEWIKGRENYTRVDVIDGRLFVIRNLYTTTDFEYFGTLVVELNKQKIFRDISKEQMENMAICVNDTDSIMNYTAVCTKTGQKQMADSMLREYSKDSKISKPSVHKKENSTYNGYLYQQKFDNYSLGILYLAERREIYSNLYEMYDVVLFMILMFLPIIAYVVYFLKRQIQEPVKRLMKASRRMEEGNIGVRVEGGGMPNSEFGYLMESFNSMSAQVKELFDYIYDEQLARKDAQIMALQAQINPHFLNNTLEMMNWQARMNGDAVVSKMIEALGTVLDYRMNRSQVKEIYLADELRCTDAYFYIMSMRFGQRLTVKREIDETLLYIKVPPLILQPLVENAIVHGVEALKSGTIELHIYKEGEQLYLKVTNTGKVLGKEEQERIQAILSGDKDKIPQGKGKHTSIGIRNVNTRIKLVYGEEYGLFISQEREGWISSTIILPYENGEDEKLKELKEEERHTKEREKVETELKNIHQKNQSGE